MNAKGVIRFTVDGGEPESFYVIDQVTFGGKEYLMVTDVDPSDEEMDPGEDGGIALILKDTASGGEDGAESVYEIVEDDTELSAVSTLFKDTLEEFGIELEEE